DLSRLVIMLMRGASEPVHLKSLSVPELLSVVLTTCTNRIESDSGAVAVGVNVIVPDSRAVSAGTVPSFFLKSILSSPFAHFLLSVISRWMLGITGVTLIAARTASADDDLMLAPETTDAMRSASISAL